MEAEVENLLAAVGEMERNHYVCSVEAYNDNTDLWLVTWDDNEGRAWGFWATQEVLDQSFAHAVIN